MEPSLSELLAHKEEEWRALQAQQALLQEEAWQDTQQQLQEAQAELHSLREDFVYNLKLLEERDQELQRYDAAFAQAQGLEGARQAELSELKIQVVKLQQALLGQAQRAEALQQQQEQAGQEHRMQLERLHSDKNSELDQQREQYAHLKWKLERKLGELSNELALQRQELLLGFEAEMQRREHEFRLQADDMSHAVLTHELRVKVLSKELAALKEAGVRATESLQGAEAAQAELQEQLQHRDWVLRDVTAVKDARIKDLEDQLHSLQRTRKREEEMFKRRYEELDRLAREREAALGAVKCAHKEQMQLLEARAQELEAHSQALELQLYRAEGRWADATKEKDTIISRLHEDAAALQSAWDAQVAQLSKELVSRDLQVQARWEEEERLKAQLASCQQDVDRYRQQLALAEGREQDLQREKVQLELDWQRRCDGIERNLYRQSEDLVQALTTAREQVTAKLQEAEHMLCDREAALKAVSLERDQALQALGKHSLVPKEKDPEVQVPLQSQEGDIGDSAPCQEIRQLREQNATLQSVISQMRREMESLSDQVLPTAQSDGYVLALEAEIQSLKEKFKTLEEQLDAFDSSKASPPLAPVPTQILPLAEATGGSVQAAGVGVALALRKLRERARLVSFLVARLRQKVLQEPLDLATVKHDLLPELDQVHLEMRELRAQVSELEQHIQASGQEEGGTTSGLRLCTSGPGAPKREGPVEGSPGPRLQRRLKEAARRILRLCLEREQLLELGNRLRAQRGCPTGKPCLPLHAAPEAQQPSPEAPPHSGSPQGLPQATTQRQRRGSSVTCRSTRQKENRSPKPQSSPGHRKESSRHTQTTSSQASTSLQDVWKLLELGSSPSGLTSLDSSTPELATPPAPRSLPGTAITVHGVKVEAHTKAKPARLARAPARPQPAQRTPRIRNYNVKD
ncbi:coiled-coil domain-containing protein 57 isoform X3 [Erinaceus europaeus]|uniref:Coiled-coil domain-containing protein 57 isoform X3 n=1 Tax=Erinaceus europaeus TaxID=9365 RepID=A0ABM3VTN3_ERIEU|nr:coiled-coil domain-containing protein 57 isoform X3 [Erinaceus europaeus]